MLHSVPTEIHTNCTVPILLGRTIMSNDSRLLYVVYPHSRIHLSTVRPVQMDVYTELYTSLYFRIRTVQHDTSHSSYYVSSYVTHRIHHITLQRRRNIRPMERGRVVVVISTWHASFLFQSGFLVQNPKCPGTVHVV